MKFLIAASFMCIALIGHTQGGSLRGLSVAIPQKEYGVPLLSLENPSQEIKAPIANELPKQEEPTTVKPFVGSLPLIDSVPNFGSPSGEPIGNKVTIPSLPLAPIVPILQATSVVPLTIAKPVKNDSVEVTSELSNGLLPQLSNFPSLPSLPGLSNLPGLNGFPTAIVTQIVQGVTTGLPGLIGVSNSQSGPLVPLPISQQIQIPQQVSNAYLPPKPELPVVPQIPVQQSILAQPELPLLPPGLPELPAAPIVPIVPLEQPIKSEAQLSNTYLPPKPELPLSQSIIPSLPETPKEPIVIPVEQPVKVQPELPLLPPGLPELPAAPIVPIGPLPIEQPTKSEAELSTSYLPPKPELPQPQAPVIIAQQSPSSSGILIPQPELTLLQPGLPSLPASPIVPLNIQQPSFAVLIQQQQKPSEVNELPSLPVTPPKAADESKEGYFINKPAVAAPIENVAVLPGQQQIPLAPGFISSQILDISQASHNQPPQGILVQPQVPVQQILVQQLEFAQPPRQEVAPAQPILAQSEGLAHQGYSYEAPQLKFLLPNQY